MCDSSSTVSCASNHRSVECELRMAGVMTPSITSDVSCTQIVAFSGGKDSTALVLRLAELNEDFACLFTPTDDELPLLRDHLHAVIDLIKRPLIVPPNKSLEFWINFHNALPNWRMRWCTRQIKIQPCIDWLTLHPGKTLVIGLRADEEDREGLYGDYATYRYPFREWGWKLADVLAYNAARNVRVPDRTDCAVCPYQRLIEWWELWKLYPDRWARGEAWEAQTGHTFRSAQRDSWPAAMRDLRAEFENGRVPKDTRPAQQRCRVCSM